MSNTSRQCLLVKGSGQAIAKLVTYLPEPYAQVGRVIALKRGDGSWDNGWTVREVYNRRDSAEVNERSRDYLRQRKASDI